jgi:hypothetical protein
MNESRLEQRIQNLDPAQLRYVYGRLLVHLEAGAEPTVDDDELAERNARDRALLEEVASDLGVAQDPIPTGGEAQPLIVIAQTLPEYQQILSEAIDEAIAQRTKLDFGLSLALGTLVVAIAAAIVRPRVVVQQKKSGKTSELNVKVEFQGAKDLGGLIKSVLPFLG